MRSSAATPQPDRSDLPGRGAVWIALLLGWSALGFVAALLVWHRHAGELPFGRALLIHLPHWTAWAPITQGVRSVLARAPALTTRRRAALHVGMAAAVVLLHSGWVATWDLVNVGSDARVVWSDVVTAHLTQSGAFEVLGYFAVLGVGLLAFRTLAPPRPTATPLARETPASAPVILVRQGPAVVRIPVECIRYLEAAGNYVRIHTDRGRFATRATLGSMEGGLGKRFHRIHRSRIVNLDWVERLESRGRWDKRVQLRDGTALAASQDGWRRLHTVFGKRG